MLPFFSARAEEAARCQCLRGWAQAVGHVTPLWMGGLHDFHGGCGRRVNHCAEEGRGPRHTQSFVSEAKDCRHYSIGVFSARGCCLTRWRLQGMFTPCQRASWAAEPILLSSFTYEYLARTCCGRGNPDTTQRALLLGRVTKEEGPFSRWAPFSLEPHGPRDFGQDIPTMDSLLVIDRSTSEKATSSLLRSFCSKYKVRRVLHKNRSE